jgi:hypothetical protein
MIGEATKLSHYGEHDMLIVATLTLYPSVPQGEAYFRISVGECEITLLSVPPPSPHIYDYEIRENPTLL